MKHSKTASSIATLILITVGTGFAALPAHAETTCVTASNGAESCFDFEENIPGGMYDGDTDTTMPAPVPAPAPQVTQTTPKPAPVKAPAVKEPAVVKPEPVIQQPKEQVKQPVTETKQQTTPIKQEPSVNTPKNIAPADTYPAPAIDTTADQTADTSPAASKASKEKEPEPTGKATPEKPAATSKPTESAETTAPARVVSTPAETNIPALDVEQAAIETENNDTGFNTTLIGICTLIVLGSFSVIMYYRDRNKRKTASKEQDNTMLNDKA